METSTDLCCHYDKNFESASITKNEVRLSIANPSNNYRFNKIKSSDTEITVGLPENQRYMIILEVCDDDINGKISIESLTHNGIDNSMCNSSERYIVIQFMSYANDLIFRENETINIHVQKWIKHPESDMSGFYILNDDIHFTINLVCNNNEKNNMNKYEKQNGMIRDASKKIIIINNFMDNLSPHLVK